MSEWENITKLYKLPTAPAPAPQPATSEAADIMPSKPPGGARTTHANTGRAVYGEPFPDAMKARAVRDGVPLGELGYAVIAQRHYAVVGYVQRLPDGRVLAYRMRRDGKVGASIIPATEVLSSAPATFT
jgi:hypothetical protein